MFLRNKKKQMVGHLDVPYLLWSSPKSVSDFFGLGNQNLSDPGNGFLTTTQSRSILKKVEKKLHQIKFPCLIGY